MSRPMTRGRGDPVIAAVTEEIDKMQRALTRLRQKRQNLLGCSLRRKRRPYKNTRCAWYHGENGLIIEKIYRLSSMTAAEIGQQLGYSKGTVVRVLKARGVRLRPRHNIADYWAARRSQSHLCKDEVRA